LVISKEKYILKNNIQMINEQECTKILNEGEEKFDKDEVKLIRELLTALATIEFEQYKQLSSI